MPIADVFSTADGGGTTTIISDGKKKLVASIDFSAQANQTFAADGDFTFTTAAGSSVPTVTGKWKNLANNTGGSIQITGGRMVVNIPTTVTSQFGKWYWSAVQAPVLGFDIRTISSELLADTTFEKWAVVVEAEFDPFFTVAGSTYTSQVGTYVWANAGVMQGGTAYFNGSQTSPTRFQSAAFRAEATTGTAVNYPYNIFNFLGAAPSAGNTGNTMLQFSANTPPWNSFANPGPIKWGCTYSCRVTHNFWATSTTKFHYYNGLTDTTNAYWQSWDPTLNTNAGGYIPTATNDVWAFLCFSRSTGSGTTSVKVKALNIYIQEIL